ncbi:hypothetical protein [uncultured Tateyamaria sp.]|uniref:hypothetical protein n=1 Tax=uncultured Tateyamaria sp. TaxID=455651 RepID=UPI00260DDFCE|nr:hypothetical protein [uncultured Tateyamaria sp.]
MLHYINLCILGIVYWMLAASIYNAISSLFADENAAVQPERIIYSAIVGTLLAVFCLIHAPNLHTLVALIDPDLSRSLTTPAWETAQLVSSNGARRFISAFLILTVLANTALVLTALYILIGRSQAMPMPTRWVRSTKEPSPAALLREDYDQLRLQHRNLDVEHKKLQSEHGDAIEAITKLRATVADQKESIAAYKQEHVRLSNDLERYQDKHREVAARLSRVQEDRDGALEKMAQIKAALDESQDARAELKRHIAQLRNQSTSTSHEDPVHEEHPLLTLMEMDRQRLEAGREDGVSTASPEPPPETS